ncbi:MAG TPA: excalibur calcium-binding domain-containing protein [Mycobacterium sp.]|nr:excalibur calcium-binding domain-containing protein [Mycobacterium sp.]
MTKPPHGDKATVYYKNCAEAYAAVGHRSTKGQPGYRPGLDRDGDGIACEGAHSSRRGRCRVAANHAAPQRFSSIDNSSCVGYLAGTYLDTSRYGSGAMGWNGTKLSRSACRDI